LGEALDLGGGDVAEAQVESRSQGVIGGGPLFGPEDCAGFEAGDQFTLRVEVADFARENDVDSRRKLWAEIGANFPMVRLTLAQLLLELLLPLGLGREGGGGETQGFEITVGKGK
jgi:hypothetical protein